ncbi:MAG TPA: ATP-binding protein [Myxococcota bacterium]|nr:ATP-binding protein [Myxococcota bacterium]
MDTVDVATRIFDRIRRHGADAVRLLMLDSVPEHEHLDFKEVSTRGKDADRENFKNLAKTVGGFANSGGGVVIWGIKDPHKQRTDPENEQSGRPAVPSQLVQWTPGMTSAEAVELQRKFLDHLHRVVHPPVPGVGFHAVEDPDSGRAVLAMFVPSRGRGPVRSDAASDHRCYYMRSGSSFAPIPHDILSRMFGAEAVADVRVHFVVRDGATLSKTDAERGIAWCEVDVYLSNWGEGFADRPYALIDDWRATIEVRDASGGPRADAKDRPPARTFRSPQRTSVVTQPEVTVPPGGTLNIATIKIELHLRSFETNQSAVPGFQITAGAKTGLPNVVRVQAVDGWRESIRGIVKDGAPTGRVWNTLFPGAPMLSHWLDLGAESDHLFRPGA